MANQPNTNIYQTKLTNNWKQLSVFQSDYYKQLLYIQSKPLSYHLFLDPIRKCKIQAYRIKINRNHVQAAAEVYQWRKNTQLPVNKTIFVNIIQQTHEHVILGIFNEFCQIRMSQLYQIPLNQILYLLKQSLIGFQRLFNKFGAFEINANLILVNQNNKCKVWLNENIEYNFIKFTKKTENQFLHDIIELFSEHVHNSGNSKHFFKVIANKQYFIDAILYIEEFAKDKNIKIPNSFILQSKYKMRSISQMPNLKFDNSFLYVKRNSLVPRSSRQKRQLPLEMTSTMNKSNAITNYSKQKSSRTNPTTCTYEQQKISQICPGLNKLGYLTTSNQIDINQNNIDLQRNYSNINIDQHQKYSSPLIRIIQSRLQASIIMKESQQKHQKKQLESEDQSLVQIQTTKNIKDSIFEKNGWKFEDICEFGKNMKQSVQIGKQVNSANDNHSFLLLSKHNLRICDSFLPENQF